MTRAIWPSAILGMLLVLAGAGCITSDVARAKADASILDAYLFRPDGWDQAAGDAPQGLLLRVENTGGRSVSYQLLTSGLAHLDLARAGHEPASFRYDAGLGVSPEGPGATIGGGEAHAWLLNVHQVHDEERFVLVAPVVDGTPRKGQALRVELVRQEVDGTPVSPGDHVQTVTVGVWTNGTVFYTNSPAVLQDPDAPLGGHIDPRAALNESDPLPVYVYDATSDEQPAGSKDTCHFTTIRGYNDLLKNQVAGGVGVRFLAPGEAYTRPGAEDHFLYGDALVFLNVVVAHDGATGPEDRLPDPQGACFNAQNAVPGGILPPI